MYMQTDWKNTFLSLSDSIERAALIINDNSIYRVALVVDEQSVLLGTITDGDIRRAIINHVSMDSKVEGIMNFLSTC